jgi:hypothetical protein
MAHIIARSRRRRGNLGHTSYERKAKLRLLRFARNDTNVSTKSAIENEKSEDFIG